MARVLSFFVLLNCLISAGAVTTAAYIKTNKFNTTLASIEKTGGPGEYWAYRSQDFTGHYEQFSGIHGIVICGQLEPTNEPLPSVAFPLSMSMRNEIQVTLVKGSCASPPVRPQ